MLKFFFKLCRIMLGAAFVVLVLVACRGNTSSTKEIKQNAPKIQNSLSVTNIRAIDFNNFTYPSSCWSDEKITVVNGEYKKIDEGDSYEFGVWAPIYGDLNGDGQEEAVIRSDCHAGGTGQFTNAYLFAIRNGKLVLLTEIEGGDRGFGGIADIKILGHHLFVERNDGEANCCAERTITTQYQLENDKLIPVGKPKSKKLKEL